MNCTRTATMRECTFIPISLMWVGRITFNTSSRHTYRLCTYNVSCQANDNAKRRHQHTLPLTFAHCASVFTHEQHVWNFDFAKSDAFIRAYIECALFASNDDDDRPLDENYSIEDIEPESLARMIADCVKFQYNTPTLLLGTKGGHDFWLTRNRHGAGFWDGDWDESNEESFWDDDLKEPNGADDRKESIATVLTRSAHSFGECYLHVGTNGKLYTF